MFSTRRLVRWTVVIAICIVATLACWQDPLYAHQGQWLTIEPGGPGPVATGALGTVLVTAFGLLLGRRGQRTAVAR